jgi:N-acetylmuramoyl-L-alanine amidase
LQKRFLIILFIISLGFMAIPPSAQAASSTHTVTVDGLRLRAGPSIDDEIIATLSEGDSLVVQAKQEGWAKVLWGEQEGWVSAQYLRANKVASVNAEFLNLRDQPSLEAAILDLAPYGTTLSILEEPGGWSKVIYHDHVGWMKSDFLSDPTTISSERLPEALKASQVKMVAIDALNVRSGPSSDSERIKVLPGGSLVTVLDTKDRWWRIQMGDLEAWVFSEYLVDTNPDAVVAALGGNSIGDPIIQTPPPDIARLQEGDKALVAQANASGHGNEGVLVESEKYLGIPYVWGGASPAEGFDCSGYVMYLFGQLGVELPHGAEAISAYGTPVEFANLQPGDVIFFQNTYRYGVSHLGIWVGNNTFIHAPEPGSVVCYEQLKGFYLDHYWGARRITP